jgi:hypothetical protein
VRRTSDGMRFRGAHVDHRVQYRFFKFHFRSVLLYTFFVALCTFPALVHTQLGDTETGRCGLNILFILSISECQAILVYFSCMVMHIPNTLYPGGIRTGNILFFRRKRRHLHHAARANIMYCCPFLFEETVAH